MNDNKNFEEMDELEKFILDNKSSFNEDRPSPKIWENIDQILTEKNKPQRSRFYLMKIAASVLFILAVGIGIGHYASNDSNDNFYAEVSQYDENFKETEIYYNQKVDNRLKALEKYNVKPNIAELDLIYKELRNEFETVQNKNKEQLVNAMIENYKTRLDILELILSRMEESETDTQKLIY